MRAYRAILEAGEGASYGVIFPELPGCVSAGATPETARRNAAEALSLHLAGLREDGTPFPGAKPLDAPLPNWLTEGSPQLQLGERLSIIPTPCVLGTRCPATPL